MLILGEPKGALVARFHEGDLATREIDEHPLLSRWTRVARLGLRPDNEAHPAGTTGVDLAERRDRLEAVFREEASLLGPMADELAARGMLALLADPDGVILLARGGGALHAEALRVRLTEGSRWSEGARGTNAIGTAIAERRPVAVIGAAHFEERNRSLFCYAAPIHDAYGDLVAVLDVTGAIEHHDPAVALAVRAATSALERALHLREHAAAVPGGLAVLERMLERAASPAMLVDARGAVLSLNTPAHEALGITDGRGLTAERVFGASLQTLQAMALSQRDPEVRFETHTGRYRLALEPIRGPAGRLLALVVYLDPDRRRPVTAAGQGTFAPPSTVAPAPAPPPPRAADPRPLHPAFDAILGTDPDLVAAKRMAARFAPTPLPVLLLAETGTGKELFARATHAASSRGSGPFVALNCGALAPGLLESELFGHAPGAFTGAQRTGSFGKLAAADGGTLFLDEIAEMPDTLQATLLRVLEDGSYYRVGEPRPRRADFRLVCATCRDLPALVNAGQFRRDLFFRIQGTCITIPPLRARADRLVLARGLLARLATAAGLPCPELADDAVEQILTHDWPGNVRELKSALEHALVMADGGPVIDRACFPRVLLQHRPPPEQPTSPRLLPDPAPRTRDAIVDEAMLSALEESAGNISRAARRLGVARSTLYRRLPPRSPRGGGG